MGRFEHAFAPLRRDHGINYETEAREKNYRPLWYWRLREEHPKGDVTLRYSVIRGWIPIPSPIWVVVRKTGQRWSVISYDAWY
jgi:hypothetical protein